MKSIGIVSLLLCAIIAFASAESTLDSSSIKIEVFAGSNPWWIAVAIRDANATTRSLQIRDERFSWEYMEHVDSWGYYTYSARGYEFSFPISFRLSSANGEQILVNNAVYFVDGTTQTVDTGVQYGPEGAVVPVIPPAPTTSEPEPNKDTPAPPNSGATTRPTTTTTTTTAEPEKYTTTTTTTQEPTTSTTTTTQAPTTSTTTTTTTQAPTTSTTTTTTQAPTTSTTTTTTTQAPTTSTTTTTTTTTQAPTTSTTTTTTKAPTTTTTTTRAPANNDCSTPMKVMIPLYVYPGAAWDRIIESASKTPVVAIINPASGPGNGPNADYVKYMDKMAAAGVEMIGYVHTSWGARDINTVKAEINKYAMNFPHVVGIFLDEGSPDASQLSYYKELHSYIMSMPGYKYNVINPGVVPDAGYLDAATQIVTLENYASVISGHSAPSYGSCANKNKFVAIVHSAGESSLGSYLDALNSKGYFGYVYLTERSDMCCAYNSLVTYYSAMVNYIASYIN